MHYSRFFLGHRLLQRNWPLQMNFYRQANHKSVQFSCSRTQRRAGILLFTCHFCSHQIISPSFSIAQARDFFTGSQLQTSSATFLNFNSSKYQLLEQLLIISACLETAQWSVRCLCGSVSSAASWLPACGQGNIIILVGAVSKHPQHQMQVNHS